MTIPTQLSYVPFEIAGLMTDASVTYSRTLAPLSHPEQDSIDYLFEDMDQPTAFKLRKRLGLSGPGGGPALLGSGGEGALCGGRAGHAPTRLAQSTR